MKKEIKEMMEMVKKMQNLKANMRKIARLNKANGVKKMSNMEEIEMLNKAVNMKKMSNMVGNVVADICSIIDISLFNGLTNTKDFEREHFMIALQVVSHISTYVMAQLDGNVNGHIYKLQLEQFLKMIKKDCMNKELRDSLVCVAQHNTTKLRNK